jgi:hypothetical protein
LRGVISLTRLSRQFVRRTDTSGVKVQAERTSLIRR